MTITIAIILRVSGALIRQAGMCITKALLIPSAICLMVPKLIPIIVPLPTLSCFGITANSISYIIFPIGLCIGCIH